MFIWFNSKRDLLFLFTLKIKLIVDFVDIKYATFLFLWNFIYAIQQIFKTHSMYIYSIKNYIFTIL